MGYLAALKRSLLGTALPYGYTITIFSTGQVVIHHRSTPSVYEVYLFAAGAAAAYGALRLMTHSLESAGDSLSASAHPVRAGVVHVVSIGSAIGAGTLVALIDAAVAWFLAALCATAAYLLVNAVELRLQARGDDG